MRLKIFSVLALLLALGSPALAFGPSAGDTFNGGTINRGLTNNGGTTQVGSTVITSIGTPAAPTVTPITTGSTTAVYYCDALDINGLTNLTGGSGNTEPSLGTTITNGNATPDTTVTCGPQTGALGYVVTKGATGGATSLLGSCLTLASGNKCPVTDIGQTLTTYTANTEDFTGEILVNGVGFSNHVGYVGFITNFGLTVGNSYVTGNGISSNFFTIPNAGGFGGYRCIDFGGTPRTCIDINSSNVEEIGSSAGIVTIGLNNPVAFETIYSASGTAIPACATAYAHAAACVSDSTACTSLTTYTSGGSTNCHVHCNGTNWLEDGFGC